MKGLSVYTFRSSLGDCTLNGVTSKQNKFILVGDEIPELFEVEKDVPYLVLVRNTYGPTEYLHAEPYLNGERMGISPMAGGNYIMTFDSRFPNDYPISVHDRFEQ